MCLFILLLMVIPAFFTLQFLVNDSYSIFVGVQEKLSSGIFSGCQFVICGKIEHFIQNPVVSEQISSITESLTSKILQTGSGILLSIPKLFLNLFVMFLTLYYFLKHGAELVERLNHYLQLQKKQYSFILLRLKEIVHGIIYGYLMVAIIQGSLGAIGFYFFGIPSPLFWGLVMAILALIPVLGTGFVWVPAAIILMIDGLSQSSNLLVLKGAGLFLYGLLIVSTMDNILKPKLISEKAKVHPLVILIGVLGGLVFFGVLGVIIGPLVLSMTQVLMEAYFSKKK